ncbi:MAG TPA: hypothetical protein VGG06_26440 [Thermoanaerobaculia bacterium]|jgi:hypothetical protein
MADSYAEDAAALGPALRAHSDFGPRRGGTWAGRKYTPTAATCYDLQLSRRPLREPDVMGIHELVIEMTLLERRLTLYEEKYGILSEDFYSALTAGKLSHFDAFDETRADFSRWKGIYETWLRRKKAYSRKLEHRTCHSPTSQPRAVLGVGTSGTLLAGFGTLRSAARRLAASSEGTIAFTCRSRRTGGRARRLALRRSVRSSRRADGCTDHSGNASLVSLP